MQMSSVPPGLFRTRLVGVGAGTTQVFAQLRQAQPPTCGLGTGLYGCRLRVSNDAQEGEWELVGIRDQLYVNLSRCRYVQRRAESVQPEDLVELHFLVAGSTNVNLSENGQLCLGSPNLTIVRQCAGTPYIVSCDPGIWRSVGIHIPRSVFKSFALAALGADSRILALIDGNDEAQIVVHQMPLGMGALSAVEQLLNNPHEGYRRLLYAEAKVYEVLCACLDLWQANQQSETTASCLSSRDLRLIERARDLLLQDPSQALTIPQLARAVGTNTSKLKRGFKFLYGTTIFEIGHRFRMDHSLRLLVENRLSVREVSAAVGYQHQTSFTAAFRDCFGVAPKDARRMVQTGELSVHRTVET